MTQPDADYVAQLFAALAHHLRVEIIRLLLKEEKDTKGLYFSLDKWDKHEVEYHLQRLQAAHLVAYRQERRKRYYFLRYKEMLAIILDEAEEYSRQLQQKN